MAAVEHHQHVLGLLAQRRQPRPQRVVAEVLRAVARAQVVEGDQRLVVAVCFVAVVVGDLLAGGNHMTRNEIRAVLPAGWAEEKGFQMAYLMMYAELEGVDADGVLQQVLEQVRVPI